MGLVRAVRCPPDKSLVRIQARPQSIRSIIMITLKELNNEVEDIKNRNKRVEQDIRWETREGVSYSIPVNLNL